MKHLYQMHPAYFMKVFNCARVHIGNYAGGYIAFLAQDDTYFSAKCGYKVLQGEVSIKHLKPIKIKGAQDEAGESKYTQDHIIRTVVLYPKTNECVVDIFSRRGSFIINLVKYNGQGKSTMYKMRL